MAADGEEQFGPVDPTPRAPYRPSERRLPTIEDEDEKDMQDWYCFSPRNTMPEPAVDAGGSPQLILQNVVSTFAIDCRVDLDYVAKRARNCEYNPRRFSAVIMRLQDPKTTAMIFASGKGICTGAKDIAQSKLAARKFARMIKNFVHEGSFQNFEIQNLVATVDVKFRINLERLKLVSDFNCLYEPELFTGLILRMRRPKIVMLIFGSGKMVMTGAKVKFLSENISRK